MKQDFVSILITLVVGIFLGAYLYITGFAPLLTGNTVREAVDLSALTINADLYGACGDDCSSFQVLNDGSYSYLYRPVNGGDMVLRRGTLPRVIQRDLARALEEPEVLATMSTESVNASCDLKVGGFNVTYSITLAGEEYVIDSCQSNVREEDELWTALFDVWMYLASLRNNS